VYLTHLYNNATAVIDPKIPLTLTLFHKGRGNYFEFPSLDGRGLREGEYIFMLLCEPKVHDGFP
jgi:hypothetical protein